MTSERSAAYRRVQATLANLGPAKLCPKELEELLDIVDVVFFEEDDWRARLAAADTLLSRLVESGRWLPATAYRLASDLAACGIRPVTLEEIR